MKLLNSSLGGECVVLPGECVDLAFTVRRRGHLEITVGVSERETIAAEACYFAAEKLGNFGGGDFQN